MVVAAGASTRTRALGPKLWLEIDGRPLVALTLDRIRVSGGHAGGVLVVREAERERAESLVSAMCSASAAWKTTLGGSSRSRSVAAGLRVLPELGAADDDLVLIHDGARPLVSSALVARVLEGARRTGAALPVVPATDTVKIVSPAGGLVERTLPRDRLGLAQTPQGFRLELVARAHEALGGYEPTDDAEAVERLGQAVTAVEGDAQNRKITIAADVEWLRWRLGQGAVG